MDGCFLPGSQFPPGFRFHPTDQELIIHYLRKKVTSSVTPATSIIADIDLYKFNPWQLPGKAMFGEGEWFFFTPRDRKYPNGSRPNRAAESGYWKATGTDKPIIAVGGSECLGVKKALVFYEGKPPKGVKTDWVMNEYRLLDGNKSSYWTQKHKGSMRLDDWVLCRVRQKGSMMTDTEEKQGTSNASKPSISVNSDDDIVGQKKSEIYEWSDNQLLAYLLGTQEEGRESTSEDSDSPKSLSNDNLSSGYNRYSDGLLQSPQIVSNAFDSLKRTLSFGALDELMLQTPGKRLQFSSNIYERPSPTNSFSVDQTSAEFII